jgi:hypothetical protein
VQIPTGGIARDSLLVASWEGTGETDPVKLRGRRSKSGRERMNLQRVCPEDCNLQGFLLDEFRGERLQFEA